MYLETLLQASSARLTYVKNTWELFASFFNIAHCSLLSEYFPPDFFPFLFIESVAKAFETLKKKYSRKRINSQKLSRSEVGTQEIEAAKKELEKISFLRWLDSFIRPRNYLWKYVKVQMQLMNWKTMVMAVTKVNMLGLML